MKLSHTLLIGILTFSCTACQPANVQAPAASPASAQVSPAASAAVEAPVASEAAETSPDEEQISIVLSTDAQTAATVQLELSLPDGWSIQAVEQTEEAVPGALRTALELSCEGAPMGKVYFASFEPYTDEIPPEEYYKTVYPELRLSRFCVWDPYTPVKGEGGKAETGIAVVSRIDMEHAQPGAMAAAPVSESLGILSYDCALKTYVAIEFAPDAVTEAQAREIAQKLSLV